MYTPIDTAALKRDHPVAEVVTRYGVELRRSGRALVGRCPFHADGGRPNFYVYPQSDSWYCYRCAIGGDVISFVERVEGVDFRRAVERLGGGSLALHAVRAHPARVVKPRTSRVMSLGPAERACLAAATELYQNRFLTDSAALAYCEARGLDWATLERHRVGYAAGDELAAYLRWRKLPLRAAVRVGLLSRDGREFLAGRIVLPEVRRGQPVWLIGRTLDPEATGPKYLGLPGRKPLMGWETAANASEVYVVEGVFDFLTLRSWDLPALALAGTHVRAAALEALGRFERVYLVLDNDLAGREASATLQQALGDRARVIALPGVPGVEDVADLAPLPGGRLIFAEALVEAELPLAA